MGFFAPEKAFYSTYVYKNRLVALSLPLRLGRRGWVSHDLTNSRLISPKGCDEQKSYSSLFWSKPSQGRPNKVKTENEHHEI